MRRKKRPNNQYELLTCAFSGHHLVGTDAAHVAPDDLLLVRETAGPDTATGTRWHRCLRCDSWVLRPTPAEPSRPAVESRDEIALPLRGPILRDRYVLRLIALDRAIHVLVLSLLAVVLFTFARHSHALHRDYINIMNDLSGGDPGASQAHGVLGYLGRAFKYSPAHLYTLGLVIVAYAALEATEMVGLWLNKRWAEYLTFIATTALVPYEVYELMHGVSTFKIITLIINVVVVVYLLLAKRLFGLRGGHAAEQARREVLGGWTAIEAATPGFETAPGFAAPASLAAKTYPV
ncbi:MAG TPA: DUF2127 domain-containing protein [Acidimicrobiales bacterium]|jgi:uncharacterized membrane protein (DUF2068 family)|nr:DUF2127 domain-containing protein [Acidimicrobiales bacterium]